MAVAKKKGSDITDLKRQIKDNSLRNLYLFYGEEDYLKEMYTNKIKEKIPDNGFEEFNHIVMDGDSSLSDFDDIWESFPMMSDRRVLIIRNSNIFRLAPKGPNEETKNFWLEKLKRINDDTVVIFSENSVDKRSAIYKAVAKIGMTVEFAYQDENDLVTFVLGQALRAKKKLSKDLALYIVTRCDEGLLNLTNELGKLFDYCHEEITKSDIEAVVAKGINISTFELTNGIMEHNAKKTSEILSDLKSRNESAFPILYLIYSNAQKLYKTKLLVGESPDVVAREIGTGQYVARKYIDAVKDFDVSLLEKMIIRVPEIDLEIKQGRADEWTLLEQYVTECFHK